MAAKHVGKFSRFVALLFIAIRAHRTAGNRAIKDQRWLIGAATFDIVVQRVVADVAYGTYKPAIKQLN